MDTSLAYIGRITGLEPIEGADFIVCATVVCGAGGKWRGVVRKSDFEGDAECVVFLPDAVIPPRDDMKFMESSNWRVRMRRFKGAPSEVVIIPYNGSEKIGTDVTELFGVTKYHKPVPANLQGKMIGEFPSFIPKTDEPNYQSVPELVEMLKGKGYFISVKMDGSSTTAYKYKGHFGVCSRNWELERDENNGYWQVAIKYKLEELLPEGYALQWETCGPKIQGNPMGLKEIDGFAFSAYKIDERRYLEGMEFVLFCTLFDFPTCKICEHGHTFQKDTLEFLGEGTYENGRQREGVVVRSTLNLLEHKPISFKVINLNYEK